MLGGGDGAGSTGDRFCGTPPPLTPVLSQGAGDCEEMHGDSTLAMQKLLTELQLMLSSGLSESVDTFITFTSRKLSSQPLYHHFLSLQAQALHEMKEFEKAESIFKKALQFNKRTSGSSNISSATGPTKLLGDDDFYCKLAVTQIARKNYSAAVQSLLTIPAESRTLKVRVLLLRVNILVGCPHEQVMQEIKELLKRHPLALELVTLLFSRCGGYGLSGPCKELIAIVHKATSFSGSDVKLSSQYFSWIAPWIRLKAMEFSCNYDLTNLQQSATDLMNQCGMLAPVLCTVAVCQYNVGDFDNARSNFSEARQKDPLITYGMPKYCLILHHSKDTLNLDIVSTKMMSINPDSAEALVCLGYYCLSSVSSDQNKAGRVLYVAHKAIINDSKCYDALLLKAKALSSRDMAKYDEAIVHFREVLRWRPWCFEAHSGIVDCQLQKMVLPNADKGSCHSQALVTALSAVRTCGKTPRSFTLVARVFRKDLSSADNTDKIHSTLDKALALDGKYLEAIVLKVDVFLQEKKQNEAINFMKSKLESGLQDAACLHEKLSIIYSKCGRKEEAITHKSAYYSLCKMREGESQMRSFEQQILSAGGGLASGGGVPGSGYRPSTGGSLGDLSMSLTDDDSPTPDRATVTGPTGALTIVDATFSSNDVSF